MEFEVLRKERIFDEFFKVDRVELKHEQFDDKGWLHVQRYHLNRPDAVAVVLENRDTGKIVLVEQFRYASLKQSTRNGWLIEIVAGLIDPGETPEACARRETLEEVGFQINKLEKITSYFPSAGISDERVHLFYAQVDIHCKVALGGGIAEEKEDLKILEIDFEELLSQIKEGAITDGKTIVGLQWLALEKSRRD